MSRSDYIHKYRQPIEELLYFEKSLRKIARDNHISLSTVVRLHRKFH